MAGKKIEIYDTTLRDGTQGEGVNLSLQDKLDITRLLDDMGIDYLEGGWPGSNPKDIEYFTRVRDIELTHLSVVAFGSTHRGDVSPADDLFLQELIAAKADVICIFGKTWDLHVEQALRVSHDRNLEMIAGSIEYLSKQTGKPVFYDAEHFFDGFKSDPDYALESLSVACQAGAERVILCDTNGGVMPHELADGIKQVRLAIPNVDLGIHVHNDGGLAVANTLRAVEEGVIQVHGTVNGIGERCGNVDLTSIIANLELKMGYRCLPQGQIRELTNLSRKIWEFLGQEGPLGQPFVGRSAFAHKGGVHVSAVQRNTTTYEHIDPDTVGNSRKILISELAGGSNLRANLSNRYPEIEDALAVRSILTEVQEKEHVGYSFENADGSFDLVVRQHIGKYRKCFEPLYYRIYSPSNEDHADSDGLIEASVKVRVEEDVELCAAEGNGPVDALNRALRKGLVGRFPVLVDLHLTDYNVKVINSSEETAAKVRVYLEHSFQGESFGTVGVNVDIIKASWTALVEAYEYALLQYEEFLAELPPKSS
ncbi:MAG: citramalate synthase [Pseudomonadales bacterium]|jgi:2-isopropylmalate synthase|nr:citramalate synthase [Pseudomonadales bacterium]MDP7358543.1 citramalate synthase [Pseudomonadales bacterium]MDP7595131.1 citramalate synthase [Pseudomonadales bacterium]HJN48889.1 citramalate synthase [Pseudomonadales bacterium]